MLTLAHADCPASIYALLFATILKIKEPRGHNWFWNQSTDFCPIHNNELKRARIKAHIPSRSGAGKWVKTLFNNNLSLSGM